MIALDAWGSDERTSAARRRPGPGCDLTACMPELGTLTSRQAASLSGVAPHPRQSGSSGARGRCQAGRDPVRALLSRVRPAASAAKPRACAGSTSACANGKPFKLAIAAATRKFIVTRNTMLRSHQVRRPRPA